MLVLFVSPTIPLPFLSLIPTYSVLLLFLFFFLFFTGTFIFKTKRHGILLGFFAVTYLLFRINNLTHPFFFILLLALFFMIELLISYKKDTEKPF